MDKQDLLKQFADEVRELYNKHVGNFVKANSFLERQDFDGFFAYYNEQPLEVLQEMVKAQHIAYNNLFAEADKRHKQLMQIMKEISQANTAEEIARLKKKADVTLMAQNLANSGKSVEEIEKILKGEQQRIFTNETSPSKIIV